MREIIQSFVFIDDLGADVRNFLDICYILLFYQLAGQLKLSWELLMNRSNSEELLSGSWQVIPLQMNVNQSIEIVIG